MTPTIEGALEGESDIRGHLQSLYGYTLRYPKARVLELGVRYGKSTGAFLAGVEKVDGHLWSVDLGRPIVAEEWFDLPFWTFIKGDDLKVKVPDEFDIVFIDTSHEKEHTLAELERFYPMVVKGGVILLHDTDLPGSGVRDALDEFGQVWANIEGYNGLGVIEK